MGKYIPPEKMTIDQILIEIDNAYIRWNNIANNGCQDPFWPDGCNMNLIRNHIIYWYNILSTKKAELEAQQAQQMQLSLFSNEEDVEDVVTFTIKPIPPEVPSNYMVSGCRYSNRLKSRSIKDIVWGYKGQYKA